MKLIRTENDVDTLASQIRASLDHVEGVELETLDKTVDYTIQSILGRQLSMYAGLVGSQKTQLDKAVEKLTEAAEAHNGSEVSDQNLWRADNWCKLQESKLMFLEQYVESEMAQANAAYLAHFSKKWVPYSESRNIADKMKVTAAAVDAQTTLERIKARQQSK